MRREARHHLELARLAERQYGIVSYEQLRKLGYSSAAVARASATGRIHRIYRGAYAVGYPGVSHQGRCLAAVFASGRGALLSHRSAAWLWGIGTTFPKHPEVTAPSRGHRRGEIAIHHSTILESADLALVEAIPVTAVPRTLLDLAAAVRRRALDRALERTERRGLLDCDAIDALLARAGGHRGSTPLRAALAIYRDPAFARSGPERLFLDTVLRADLPRPLINYFVAGYEVDAFWDAEQLAVEVDAFSTHGSRAAFERDRERQETLSLAGILVIRVTALRLEREPAVVVANLRALLTRRQRELNSTRG